MWRSPASEDLCCNSAERKKKPNCLLNLNAEISNDKKKKTQRLFSWTCHDQRSRLVRKFSFPHQSAVSLASSLHPLALFWIQHWLIAKAGSSSTLYAVYTVLYVVQQCCCARELLKMLPNPFLFVRLFPSFQILLAEYQRKTIFQPVFSDICICTAYAHTHVQYWFMLAALCMRVSGTCCCQTSVE